MWKPIGVGVLVLGMLAVAGCGNDGGAAAPTVVPVTAEVGGMALATVPAVDTAATAVPTPGTAATEAAAPVATPAEATGAALRPPTQK